MHVVRRKDFFTISLKISEVSWFYVHLSWYLDHVVPVNTRTFQASGAGSMSIWAGISTMLCRWRLAPSKHQELVLCPSELASRRCCAGEDSHLPSVRRRRYLDLLPTVQTEALYNNEDMQPLSEGVKKRLARYNVIYTAKCSSQKTIDFILLLILKHFLVILKRMHVVPMIRFFKIF